MQILIIFFQVEDIDNDETACLIANLIYEVKFSITISLIFFSVLTVNTLHFWITVYLFFKFIHVADHFRTKLRAISPISTRSWLSASRMLFLNSPQSCDVIKHAHDQVWTNHYTSDLMFWSCSGRFCEMFELRYGCCILKWLKFSFEYMY